jgi:hypothetical protein
VSQEIKKIAEKENLNLKIFYLGTKPFKEEILKNEGIDIYLLSRAKLTFLKKSKRPASKPFSLLLIA